MDKPILPGIFQSTFSFLVCYRTSLKIFIFNELLLLLTFVDLMRGSLTLKVSVAVHMDAFENKAHCGFAKQKNGAQFYIFFYD